VTLSIQHKVVAALTAALVVLAGVSAVSYRGMSELAHTMELVDRTHLVLRTLEQAYGSISEAEASSRGYVLTGDSAYLRPYRGAEEAVARDLARIDSLTVDVEQRRRLAALRPLVARRFEVIEQAVAVREGEGFQAAAAVVRTGRGRALMDSVRSAIDVLSDDERARLERRSRRARAGVTRAAPLFIAGILAAAAISLLVVLVVRRDVRAVTSAERALRVARDEAETASRTKSDFLARMSHELRTPLNSIIGFANVLARNPASRLTPQEREYIERVRANGVHLLALISDVLDLSKVEAGRMRLDLETVDLGALVADTLAGFEGQVRDRAVALRAGVPRGISPLVTDSAKLLQVLMNLIGNALKFTESGSVTVCVVADGADGCTPTRIDVVDTGIGIPPGRRSAIFDAFEQGDSSTSRRFGGTGLGLSISRALCDLMGYRLEVADNPTGRGSVFSVVFSGGSGTGFGAGGGTSGGTAGAGENDAARVLP